MLQLRGVTIFLILLRTRYIQYYKSKPTDADVWQQKRGMCTRLSLLFGTVISIGYQYIKKTRGGKLQLILKFQDSFHLFPQSLAALGECLCPELGGKIDLDHKQVSLDTLSENKDSYLDYMRQDIRLHGGVMKNRFAPSKVTDFCLCVSHCPKALDRHRMAQSALSFSINAPTHSPVQPISSTHTFSLPLQPSSPSLFTDRPHGWPHGEEDAPPAGRASPTPIRSRILTPTHSRTCTTSLGGGGVARGACLSDPYPVAGSAHRHADALVASPCVLEPHGEPSVSPFPSLYLALLLSMAPRNRP